jgi:hypothetical protein
VSSTFWLATLPSTDPAFAPLQRAAELSPDEFPALWSAHQQAVTDAAWGRDLDGLKERAEFLREFATHDDEPRDQDEADVWRRDELEAIGYALGVTAVKVALRERREALALAAVA